MRVFPWSAVNAFFFRCIEHQKADVRRRLGGSTDDLEALNLKLGTFGIVRRDRQFT